MATPTIFVKTERIGKIILPNLSVQEKEIALEACTFAAPKWGHLCAHHYFIQYLN